MLRGRGYGVELAEGRAGRNSRSVTSSVTNPARRFAKYGQRLYTALFEAGDDGTSLAAVNCRGGRFARAAPSERPLRLLIRAARISLPWQYLHPSGSVDAESFWGMRFSLAVQRVNTGRRQLAPTVQAGRTVAFLKVATVDPTVRYADEQIGQLRALAGEPLVIDSGKALAVWGSPAGDRGGDQLPACLCGPRVGDGGQRGAYRRERCRP